MLLADDFYCVAHDDLTGRARLHSRGLGLGLAGALLGELVLCDGLAVREGELWVTDPWAAPEALAAQTLAQIDTYVQHRKVATWLAYLAQSAAPMVAQRLRAAGILERVEFRTLGGLGPQRSAYRPRNVNTMAWRPVRLAGQLTGPDPIGPADVLLAGLVAATGLLPTVLWQPEQRGPGEARFAAEVGELHPSLRDLLACVEAAVGAAVLAPR